MKKTILSLLLSLGMCFGVFVAPVHAQSIGSNQTITGQTNGYSLNTYTYTMPKSGYFYYTLSIQGNTFTIRNSDNTDEIEKLDSRKCIFNSMKVNYETYVDNINVYYAEPYDSDYYSFAKGTKINISIYDDYNQSTQYALTIHYVNPKNFEREANNSRGKAMNIQAKKTYTGIISHSQDDDWFVYKASKTGKYKVNCMVTKEHSSSIATQVYKGYKSVNSKDVIEGDGWINILNSEYGGKNTTVKLKKNQKLYIHIYYVYCTQTWYKLNVKKA